MTTEVDSDPNELPEVVRAAIKNAAAQFVADRPVLGSPWNERYTDLSFHRGGGMGEVWKARDNTLAREVAIKIPKVGLGGSVTPEALLQEAYVLKELEHRAIVPIQDVGKLADGRPFFAMRFVKGVPLTELLGQQPLPSDYEQRFLQYFEEICRAVAKAHSQTPPILHRDLKPSNVMVVDSFEVLVVDWGIARTARGQEDAAPSADSPGAETRADALDPTPPDREPTQPGVAKGTLGFMAPEQARGENSTLQPSADVFALGGLLCVILSGRPPYPAGAEAREIEAKLGETARHLKECGADEELIELAQHCLQAKPDDRPANASAVLTAFEAAQRKIQDRLRKADDERKAAETRAAVERKLRMVQLALLVLVVVVGVGAWWGQKRIAEQVRQQQILSEQAARTERDLRTAAEESTAKAVAAQEVAESKTTEAKTNAELERKQRERADTNLGFAQRAVNHVTNTLLGDEEFSNGKFFALKKKLLDDVIPFYESIIEQTGPDEIQEAYLGGAYGVRGFVHQQMKEEEPSLADFKKFQEVFAGLTERFPENQDYRHVYAWSFCARGNALRDFRRWPEAETEYETARRLAEDLVKEFPVIPDHVGLLGGCYVESGQLDRERGQQVRAIDWYLRAIEVLKKPMPVTHVLPLLAIVKLTHEPNVYLQIACEELGGIAFATNQWHEAVEAFAEIREFNPNNHDRWYDEAVAYLGSGDSKEYRAICTKMLERFGRTKTAGIGHRVLHTCVILPDAVPESSQLIPLAEMVVKELQDDERILGAALYRANQFEKSKRELEKKANPGAWDWFFRSMVNHKLGHAEEAQRCLNQGIRCVEDEKWKQESPTGPKWTERVEVKQLRREAEVLIQSSE